MIWNCIDVTLRQIPIMLLKFELESMNEKEFVFENNGA